MPARMGPDLMLVKRLRVKQDLVADIILMF
jgi:hypothetical protein